MNKFLYILLIILLPVELLSIDSSRISDSFSRIFPGKQLEIKKLSQKELEKIINEHLEKSYSIAGIKQQQKSDAFSLDAARANFSPNLSFSTSYQNYNTWLRQDVVNKRIPVKWDNDNPIMTNINLPNGGEGIIWLPRPLAWEYRDISLNASEFYRSELFNGNISLNKKFMFGLNLSALSYSMNYRLNPDVYGFPWSSQISTSFMLPLFSGFGKEGQEKYVEMEKIKLDRKIDDESLKSIKNSVFTTVLRNFANAYYYYQKAHALDSIADLLDMQVEDVDMLVEDSRVTMTESISIKSSQRNIDYEIQYAINNFIYSAASMNFDPANSEEIIIYLPENIDIQKVIEEAISIFQRNNSDIQVESLIDNHPQIVIDQYELRQSEIDVEYYNNLKKPVINIVGSFQVFEQSRLGYSEPWIAAEKNLIKPDGVQWNFGLQYHLPLSSIKDDLFQSAVTQMRSKEIIIDNTKKQIGESIANYLFNIKSTLDNIDNSNKNLEDISKIIRTHANPLFEKHRMSRYYYCSYLRELQSGLLQKLESENQFLNYFLQFSSDMNIYVEPLIYELR